MAIRRIVARRGTIRHLYSDNGTNFRGADEELKNFWKTIDNDIISRELTEKEIQWHFNPPSAPHMGGCWERLIGSVKKVLSNMVKEEAHREEVLLTLFTEVENIINSRPLTRVSTDANDPDCLTPNHLLIGASQPTFPSCFEDVNPQKLWKRSQRLTNIFWMRWVKEFLPTLTKRGRWTDDSKPINIGDVVVVVEPNLPRNAWRLGQIEKLFPGKDHVVRVVEVRTVNGTFRRPVTRLCRLDVEGVN